MFRWPKESGEKRKNVIHQVRLPRLKISKTPPYLLPFVSNKRLIIIFFHLHAIHLCDNITLNKYYLCETFFVSFPISHLVVKSSFNRLNSCFTSFRKKKTILYCYCSSCSCGYTPDVF